jgi:hypothetical protein
MTSTVLIVLGILHEELEGNSFFGGRIWREAGNCPASDARRASAQGCGQLSYSLCLVNLGLCSDAQIEGLNDD